MIYQAKKKKRIEVTKSHLMSCKDGYLLPDTVTLHPHVQSSTGSTDVHPTPTIKKCTSPHALHPKHNASSTQTSLDAQLMAKRRLNSEDVYWKALQPAATRDRRLLEWVLWCPRLCKSVLAAEGTKIMEGKSRVHFGAPSHGQGGGITCTLDHSVCCFPNKHEGKIHRWESLTEIEDEKKIKKHKD